MNIIELNKPKHEVNVIQDYSELIANYELKVLKMKRQVQVSHDFICVIAMDRDHESKGAALRHAIDEVVAKIKLKRANEAWN